MLEWLLKLSRKRKEQCCGNPFFRMGWVQLMAGIIMLVVIPVTASLIRYGQVQDKEEALSM